MGNMRASPVLKQVHASLFSEFGVSEVFVFGVSEVFEMHT
jgi:hypothetical protein